MPGDAERVIRLQAGDVLTDLRAGQREATSVPVMGNRSANGCDSPDRRRNPPTRTVVPIVTEGPQHGVGRLYVTVIE